MRRDGAVLCYILHKDTKLYLLPQGIYKMCKTCKAWKSLLAWEGESPWQTMDCPTCGHCPQLPTSGEQPSEISITFMGVVDKGSGMDIAGWVWSWNKTECPQFWCVKALWKKMTKEWGIMFPVIIPEWCMPLSSLLLPWALLSYHTADPLVITIKIINTLCSSRT